MLEAIKPIFHKEGIERIGMLKIEDCEIINQRILPEWSKSVIMFAIPYRSDTPTENDGFSEYARIYDYHNFAKELYERIIINLSNITGFQFKGFCDHSPINEKLAIAKCGLGVIGRNSLYIDDVYGSFVFLGSITTNFECNSIPKDIKNCIKCNLCAEKCPNSAIKDQGIDRFTCLSGISQKKNKTEEEKEILKKHNIVWGCDICQLVCPYNANTKKSPIPYFSETRIKRIDKEFILNLTDEQFSKYAFSYKGKKIVLDNIDFI